MSDRGRERTSFIESVFVYGSADQLKEGSTFVQVNYEVHGFELMGHTVWMLSVF